MDAWINPLTRDYERTQATVGDLVRSPGQGLANAVYLRIQTPLGTWFGDPTLGSRLHELQREKNLPRAERLARQYAKDALKQLLVDGRASSIDIETERTKDVTGAGRLLLVITVVDEIGERHTFRIPVRVA